MNVTDTTPEPGAAARPHLSIGEVLSMLQPEFPDVTISKIRFLESQGLLDPERTPSGYRKFYDGDLARLRWILTQQRDHFLPLKVIKERLAEDPNLTVEATAATRTPRADIPIPQPAAPAVGAPPVQGVDRAALAEALERRAALRAEAGVAGGTVRDAGPSDVTFNTAELAAAAGIADRDVERLVSFGLIEGRTLGREVIFDGDALVIARLAAAFLQHGLEPRHLRMFKVAAEREALVYEQLVASIARLRDPDARARVDARMNELTGLGQQLQGALLRRAVRDIGHR
jgi:DNA-binding transcriptional MerR regulator